MKTIVNDPLFKKCQTVLDSCQTKNQLEVSKKYLELAIRDFIRKNISKNFNIKFFRIDGFVILSFDDKCNNTIKSYYNVKDVVFYYDELYKNKLEKEKV